MPSNKFNTYKAQFQNDTKTEEEGSTGLKWDENIPMYILYYKARIIDDFLGNVEGRFSDQDFRDQFTSHTQLEWADNIATFILYYRDGVMEDFLGDLQTRFTTIANEISGIKSRLDDLETFQSDTEGRLDDIEERLTNFIG